MRTLGVRQEKNISCFYLQYTCTLMTLTIVLRQNNVTGRICSSSEFGDNILIFVKILMFLYADDTVLICESEVGRKPLRN